MIHIFSRDIIALQWRICNESKDYDHFVSQYTELFI